MASEGLLKVRVLELGDAAPVALAALSRAIRDHWPGGGRASVESVRAGEDARLAARTIRAWCDRERVDAVFTIGRGGHLPGDFAPAITAPLLDRALPGVEEHMRLGAGRSPRDLLFRGRAGMRGGSFVVNLPDRPARAAAIVRTLGPVVPHALEKARGSDRACARPGEAR